MAAYPCRAGGLLCSAQPIRSTVPYIALLCCSELEWWVGDPEISLGSRWEGVGYVWGAQGQ